MVSPNLETGIPLLPLSPNQRHRIHQAYSVGAVLPIHFLAAASHEAINSSYYGLLFLSDKSDM